jgi:hypothetical protein
LTELQQKLTQQCCTAPIFPPVVRRPVLPQISGKILIEENNVKLA